MIISLSIKNWNKFNPRSDRANYTWFRFQNDLLHDPKLFPLSECEKLTYIFLLCEASKKNSETIELSIAYASAILRFKEKEIQNYINGLDKCGLVTAKSRHDDGEQMGVIPATYERDVTNERTNELVEMDFDAIALFNLWNENCGSLPKSRELSKTRKSSATARLKEKPERLFWEEVIFRIRDSAFCNGESDTGWRATFDWLLKPDTHMKVLEGKYDKIKKEPANIDGLFRKSSA